MFKSNFCNLFIHLSLTFPITNHFNDNQNKLWKISLYSLKRSKYYYNIHSIISTNNKLINLN